MVAHNPIIGVGLNTYVLEMSRYDHDGITETFYYPVHNIYMLLAGELGIVGLSLYVAIFVAFVFRAAAAFRSKHPAQAALGFSVFLALVAFAVDGLIEGDTLGSRTFMIFWIAGGCASALYQKLPPAKVLERRTLTTCQELVAQPCEDSAIETTPKRSLCAPHNRQLLRTHTNTK
jgi:O-antigen ligase